MLSFVYYSTLTRYTGDIPLISDALSSDNRLLGNTAILNEAHSNADTYPLSPTLSSLSLTLFLLSLHCFAGDMRCIIVCILIARAEPDEFCVPQKCFFFFVASSVSAIVTPMYVCMCTLHTPRHTCIHMYIHIHSCFYGIWYTYRYMDNCFQTAECISCLNYLQIISELCDHLVTYLTNCLRCASCGVLMKDQSNMLRG